MAKVIDPKEQIVVCRRDRRLRASPHWEEVELRLRHRWSPRQVVTWYRERWPSERLPSVPTLYRFLEDQEAGWFLPELVDTRRLPRVLPLEEHAHLMITQLMRVRRCLTLEEQFGMPVPETRMNIALADQMLQTQFRMAQEMGSSRSRVQSRRRTATVANRAWKRWCAESSRCRRTSTCRCCTICFARSTRPTSTGLRACYPG